MARLVTLAALIVGTLASDMCWAQAEFEPEVVVENLDRPWGVAIQPKTGHIFISESGRSRVVRVVDGQTEEVVVGFPRDDAHDIPGTLGLAFLNREFLVVGGGGDASGEGRIYVVQVPADGGQPIVADQALRFGPLAPERFNIYGLVTTPEAVFATGNPSHGDAGAILVLPIRTASQLDRASSFGKLASLIGDSVPSPTAIARSPRGELVVGHADRLAGSNGARLAFYRIADGKQLLELPTGLERFTGLLYGAPLPPDKTSQLYALNANEQDSESAGLYRLDASLQNGQIVVQGHRIAPFQQPTAMAMAPDGALFVTDLGKVNTSNPTAAGRLFRIAPGL